MSAFACPRGAVDRDLRSLSAVGRLMADAATMIGSRLSVAQLS